MSKNDDDKEEKESNLFQEAVLESQKSDIRTQKILRFLDGETIDREKNDSPDLIKKCSRKNKTIYVGIEHFHVDQVSKKKRGKMNAIGEECNKKILEVYEVGHEYYIKGEKIPDDVSEELLKQTLNYFHELLKSNIVSLLDALKKAVEKHSSKIDVYIENTRKTVCSKEVEIALFIDFFVDYSSMYAFDGKQFEEVKEIPIIKEIVSILQESIDSKKIQYIVLFFKNQRLKEEELPPKVIAFRTGNMVQNIKKQKQIIYHFIGGKIARDYNLLDGNLTYKRNEDGNYRIKTELKDFGEGEFLRVVAPYLKEAYIKQKLGIPFITSQVIKKLLKNYKYFRDTNI